MSTPRPAGRRRRAPGCAASLPESAIAIQQPRRSRSKYGNRKTEYRGVLYDSALEAEVAKTLDMLPQVVAWERQVPYTLIPRQRTGERPTIYVADFIVSCTPGPPWRHLTLEVKGYETAVSKLKRRLMAFQHPSVRLIVVKRVEDVVAAIEEAQA